MSQKNRSTWWEGFVNQVRGFGSYSKCNGEPSERGVSQTDLLSAVCETAKQSQE